MSLAEEVNDVVATLMLLSLPDLGPARVRWLIAEVPPELAVERLKRGELPPNPRPRGVTEALIHKWRSELAIADSEDLLRRELDIDSTLLSPSVDNWPFDDDPEPPALLFIRGDAGLLATGPKVGIVGTRRCTAVGRKVAYQLGHDLALAGVTVVSGLASGIDAAAHRGTLAAGGSAIGVVASGLNVPYPASNADLWAQVGAEGLLMTEALAGTKPARWRFPARNRLIAGLVDLVVVVESHKSGGSLITADEALERGVAVAAVPGTVLSSASHGTNALLVDGAVFVRSATDVLETIGHSCAVGAPTFAPNAGTCRGLGIEAERALQEISASDTHIDKLASVLNLPFIELVMILNQLELMGLIGRDGATYHIR